MKIGIITKHAVPNYGSILQSIATRRVLESLGHEVEFINYYEKAEQSFHKCKREISGTGWERTPLHRALFYVSHFPDAEIKYARFQTFVRRYLVTTPLYSSLEELRWADLRYDVFCTGSDQVWNKIRNRYFDEAYFLTFAPEGSRKIAFSASFGEGAFEIEAIEFLRSRISRYDAVSTREASGVELLRGMGITSARVLDPTLMLTADEWKAMAMRKKEQKPYILLYQLHQNEALSRYAAQLADRLSCKLKRVSVSLLALRQRGTVCLPSIPEFLRLFSDARCVVTDSFHATAFSVNLNVPFAVSLPRMAPDRIAEFLKMTELEDRILQRFDDFDTPMRPIQFENTNGLLDRERRETLAWLERALGGP